ncbi:3-phosphoshikimate 1-carboxyvinyltransferase [Galactobacter valiniphilus]|uniref:3-phosphoshikimate 1-carboxyvinyltransferase n=1 Tax=Galactobacter valiniphilus TaxID=2676122 RepID=UPI003736C496
MTQHWSAPVSPGRLDATVELPGSKSLTNRHLLLAALAGEPTQLTAPLDSRDTRLMAKALGTLGAVVETEGRTPGGAPLWSVTPLRLDAAPAGGEPLEIDCGLAGTVMRFVPAVAALLRTPVRFDGDPAARRRPMGPVIEALRQLGATTEGGEDGFLPFTVTGNDAVAGGEISIDASGSSQFVSALLLSAARLPLGLTVRHTGASLPSPQHIEMTLEVLRAAGVPASTGADGRSWSVGAAVPAPGDVVVEPDLSNAGPFLAAALVCGGTVRVPRWPARTTQIGALWRELLPAMGATVELGADAVLSVTGDGAPRGIDAADTGELAPTLAALCAVSEGPSRLTGIAHLRGHETDRLAALVAEFTRIGVPASELADGVQIGPAAGAEHGAVWESYEDHRMATAGAIVGLAVPGIEVENVETTAKTLPGFTRMWEAMLATATPPAPGGPAPSNAAPNEEAHA